MGMPPLEYGPRRPVYSVSRATTGVLLVLATVLTIAGICAVWADRLLLNADNWASTSTQLLQNRAVRQAVAGYLVDQLYASPEVSKALDKAVPGGAQPAAGVAALVLRPALVAGAEKGLQQPAVLDAWRAANHEAASTLIQIVDGGGANATVSGGVVTLNLRRILLQVADRAGLPGAVAKLLPASAAHLTVMRSNQIRGVQVAGRILQGLVLVLAIGVPLLYLIIFVTARGPRGRALRRVGISALVAGAVVVGLRALMVAMIPVSLDPNPATRDAARAVVSIATASLEQLAIVVMVVGALLIVTSWVVGLLGLGGGRAGRVSPPDYSVRRRAGSGF